jgi:hypothetical protein
MERWQTVGPNNVDWAVGPYKFSWNRATGKLWYWFVYFGDDRTREKDIPPDWQLKDVLTFSAELVAGAASDWLGDVSKFREEYNDL